MKTVESVFSEETVKNLLKFVLALLVRHGELPLSHFEVLEVHLVKNLLLDIFVVASTWTCIPDIAEERF